MSLVNITLAGFTKQYNDRHTILYLYNIEQDEYSWKHKRNDMANMANIHVQAQNSIVC